MPRNGFIITNESFEWFIHSLWIAIYSYAVKFTVWIAIYHFSAVSKCSGSWYSYHVKSAHIFWYIWLDPLLQEIISFLFKLYLVFSMVLELELVRITISIYIQFYPLGWTCCNVVSHQWLDEKRSQLNPYLLLESVSVYISNNI